MRGNLAGVAHSGGQGGSIPAYAGEPARPVQRDIIPAVYPRVCGGTYPTKYLLKGPEGLSPRMRGNRGAKSEDRQYPRSIPAYAGEPDRSTA